MDMGIYLGHWAQLCAIQHIHKLSNGRMERVLIKSGRHNLQGLANSLKVTYDELSRLNRAQFNRRGSKHKILQLGNEISKE